MFLVLVTALFAVCGADKLDRTYLPPATAHTAGGSPGSLQTPFRSFNNGLGGLPQGGYRNDFEGVVVDAAAPGTRASGPDATGLGGPRATYGSTDSKVGEAAFTDHGAAFPRVGIQSGTPSFTGVTSPVQPERPQASRDRASETVKYQNDVSHDSFNYAFETDNGIVAEENGIEVNGVKAQGGYSYTGDDGQVYSVSYTADEGGYQPRGDHLPTPPPIPEEILKSLEQNAKEEAAGVVDDGSYDAQKYNTGEDYTKSDTTNGYGQPYGKPQNDAAPSGSFINQNNQAFARPSSNVFGTPTRGSPTQQPFDSSKNVASSSFGLTSNKNGNGQAFGVGSGSNNEYLPPGNGFNSRPSGNQPQGNTQNGFPINKVSSGVSDNAGANNDQNSPVFIPLSQQKLQNDNPRKPQTGSPVFGKPTVIDSTLSIKDPFARPSNNRFTQNKKPQAPQSNGQVGGSFQVVSGNVYSSKNEYLPPRRQFNKQNQNKVNQGFQAPTSGIPSNGPQDFRTQAYGVGSTPSANAFASVSSPGFGIQTQQYNQQSQYAGNGLPTSIQNANGQSKGQSQFSTSFPSSPSFSSPLNSQYKPTFGSQSPTSQPQTELTTPLESNSNSAPAPVVDGPDSPSLNSYSNLPSYSAPSNDVFGQSSFNKFQQVSPTIASATAFSSIGGSSNTPGLNVEVRGNTGSLFPNRSPIDVQYSSSTLRPSYSQNTQQQGPDDSYYYNTPSKPFNIPSARPQGSSFPSPSSDQPFRVTQAPFGTKPQTSSFSQSSFTSQSSGSTGSTRYPTLEPASPTSSSIQSEPNGNNFQSQFNKVTQASASSFPSPVPTPSADFNKNQFGQFGTRPSQPGSQFNQGSLGSNLSNQPISSFAQAQVATGQPTRNDANQRLPGISRPDSTPGSLSTSQQSQQYNGEIYQYNKPPQVLPTPQKDTTPGQFGLASQVQTSQSQSSGSYKPSFQFGSPQQVSTGQTQQPSQANIQGQTQIQSESKPGQFGSRPLQGFQGNVPTNLGSTPSQSQSSSRPGQFGSSIKPTQGIQGFNYNGQAESNPTQGNQFNTQETSRQPEQRPGQLALKPSQTSQPIQGASKFPPAYNKEAPCCKAFGSQSSQTKPSGAPSGSQFDQGFGNNEPASGTKPGETVSSFAGTGETFGGPRKPPSFDANGYHY